MADRSSAEIFGEIFTFLADESEMSVEELAKWLYDKMRNYDFQPYQMECPKALVRLGLAKICEECNSPHDLIYKGWEDWHHCS